MEPKNSLSRSQETAICPYPKLDESNTHTPIHFP
jgi:hypothetical protein